MTRKDFARRYGYQEDEVTFAGPGYLPEWVRGDAGLMIIGDPHDHSDVKKFARVVIETLPYSPWMWEWFSTVQPIPKGFHLWEEGRPMTDSERYHAIHSLVRPLKYCDWRLFYTVIERICEDKRNAGMKREAPFETQLNLLLGSHRIPWMLQSGLVIPAADAEFAKDLSYAREAPSSSGLEHASDPHVLIRDALQAFYRKFDGPDISAACVHAWGAWKAAAGAASGFGARDKRSFDFVKEKYPRLYETMAAWQELAEAGRHPESAGFPTESETRFIVMLCVNAVRFLSSTRNNEADA